MRRAYWETAIRAQGILRSFGYDAPKPDEFGTAGGDWSDIGHRADVDYILLKNPLRPRDEWSQLQPLLPLKYSPLDRNNGKGLQSVYLAEISDVLGLLLGQLLVQRGNKLRVADIRTVQIGSSELAERERWEKHEEGQLMEAAVGDTERQALISARVGQGKFRENVAAIERACRVTGVSNPSYLLASHIKPWRHANNDERLSSHNGLMLAPQADYLFDRGFISFGDGRVLVSDVADPASLLKLGVDPDHPEEVGAFNDHQERFLEFHRREIFRKAI